MGGSFKNIRATAMTRMTAPNIEYHFRQAKENMHSTSSIELLPDQRLFKLP